MAIRATLAGNLKRLRKANGLSQEELAHRVGIDRTYVSALERQIYAASVDLVERLAEAFEVTPSALLATSDSEGPPAAEAVAQS